MELNSMKDLLVHQLKDLYSAERQLVRALPRMAKEASDPALQKAITDHLAETKEQVSRLEKAFRRLDVGTRGPKCKGMEGLVAEASETLELEGNEDVRDAGIIAAAQRVEHYEIAGYGCAITFAELIGESQVVALLKETLAEEEQADETLTGIAEGEVNIRARDAGMVTEEEEEE